ncbi:MAG TPA: sensor histidine kinase [Chloroflexaceae bacterium]|nr:sensor histidine kinase [Chloroflexaceae bacterium]
MEATISSRRERRAWAPWWALGALLLTLAAAGGVIWMHARVCALPFLSLEYPLVGTISGPAFAGLGLAIARRHPAHRIGWLCLAAGAGCALGDLAEAYLTCALAGPAPSAGAALVAWYQYTLMPALILVPMFVLLPLWFPTGSAPSVGWRRFSRVVLGLLGIATLGSAVVPDFRQPNGVGTTIPLTNPLGIAHLPAWWAGASGELWNVVAIGGALAAIGSLIVRFRRSGGDERQQIKWFAFFLASAVTLQLLVFELLLARLLPWFAGAAWEPVVQWSYMLVLVSVFLGFPLTIGIAIFKYRLYAIDLLINRTLAHAGLTLAITALYLLVIAGTASLTLDRRGELVGLALATAASALLIRPLYRRIRAGVDGVLPVPAPPVAPPAAPSAPAASRRAWLAWSLLLTTLGISLFGFGWLHLAGCGPALDTRSYAAWPVALAYASIGFLIVRAQPASRIGWLFLAASPVATYFSGAFVQCAGAGIIPPLGLAPLTWVHFVLFTLYGLAVYILVPLWFPDGRHLSPAWRSLTRVLLVLIAVTTAGKAVAPELYEPGMPGRYDNPIGMDWLPAWWSSFFAQANILLLLSGVLLGGVAIVVRLRRSAGVERQQLKWLSAYFVVAIGVQLLIFELPGVLWYPEGFQTVWYLPVAFSLQVAYPLVVGATIFRYRLYDIARIINRTLVYAGLSAAIVACYALIVSGLSFVFHLQQSFFSAVLATGVVALLAQPLRERLQKGVNRLMFGERDEPYAVLSRLGRQLQQSALPEQILPATAATICQTLKLPYVAISIQRGDGERQIVAAGGRPAPTTAEWPMQFRGELVGWLAVAPRSPGEGFAPDERRLLADIANQSGAVAASVRLTGALQAARERLVLAREEERRRIRRDLHDELGPTLASQTLRLDAAIDLLAERPAQAAELLGAIKARNQALVAEIRRLVYELRPPALDELGLLGALRAAAGHLGAAAPAIAISAAPEPLPALPAAVEVAAYRIALEALTNAVRHARARRCELRLEVAVDGPRGLRITVADDGRGIGLSATAGGGLRSMRERAEELGGSLTVEPGGDGGTLVRAWLPIAASAEGERR